MMKLVMLRQRPKNESRDGNQEENTGVLKEICINESTRNANHVSSDQHLNTPVRFQWNDLRGEVFVQRMEAAREEIVFYLPVRVPRWIYATH